MRQLLCFAAVVAMAYCLPAEELAEPRNLLQFGDMITCATGKGLLALIFSYNGYGCYCGLGGSGTPVDATDQCCQEHDACYEDSTNNGCLALDKYLVEYKFQAKRKVFNDPDTCEITCTKAEDYFLWEFNEDCKEYICECDRKAALCFREHQDSYDPQLEDWTQC